MFLRYTTRKKNGKEHRYYSLVENRRVARGRVVQRYALYLGEINDSQQEAWRKTIEIFEEGQARPRTVALFPEDRIGPVADADIVRIRLSRLSLHRARQWGGCWLAGELWEQLGLDHFWAERLPPSPGLSWTAWKASQRKRRTLGQCSWASSFTPSAWQASRSRFNPRPKPGE